MFRLCVRYGGSIELRNYSNLKVAERAFANRMLDRSHPDCIQLLVGGREIARVGDMWSSAA